jgi:hypothetical protein
MEQLARTLVLDLDKGIRDQQRGVIGMKRSIEQYRAGRRTIESGTWRN